MATYYSMLTADFPRHVENPVSRRRSFAHALFPGFPQHVPLPSSIPCPLFLRHSVVPLQNVKHAQSRHDRVHS